MDEAAAAPLDSPPAADPADPAETPTPAPPGRWGRLQAWAAARRDRAERNWRFLDAELQRTRLLTKVVLLHARYTFGYLAFGFLVSAPIQLGLAHAAGWVEGMFQSLALGVLFAVPALLLWPLTIIDWHRMRIPEFKNLELALTQWAALAASAWLAIAFLVSRVFEVQGWPGWLCNVEVAWTNLGLMFFSWVRVKFHMIMFREFYTLKPDDDLVLRVPPSRLKRLLESGPAALSEAERAEVAGALAAAPERDAGEGRENMEYEQGI